jgi:hypothetical protein
MKAIFLLADIIREYGVNVNTKMEFKTRHPEIIRIATGHPPECRSAYAFRTMAA